MSKNHLCRQCQTLFRPTRSLIQFCCVECRNAYQYAQKLQRQRVFAQRKRDQQKSEVSV